MRVSAIPASNYQVAKKNRLKNDTAETTPIIKDVESDSVSFKGKAAKAGAGIFGTLGAICGALVAGPFGAVIGAALGGAGGKSLGAADDEKNANDDGTPPESWETDRPEDNYYP